MDQVSMCEVACTATRSYTRGALAAENRGQRLSTSRPIEELELPIPAEDGNIVHKTVPLACIIRFRRLLGMIWTGLAITSKDKRRLMSAASFAYADFRIYLERGHS